MGICTGQGAAPALRGGRTAHGLFYRVDTSYISGLYPPNTRVGRVIVEPHMLVTCNIAADGGRSGTSARMMDPMHGTLPVDDPCGGVICQGLNCVAVFNDQGDLHRKCP